MGVWSVLVPTKVRDHESHFYWDGKGKMSTSEKSVFAHLEDDNSGYQKEYSSFQFFWITFFLHKPMYDFWGLSPIGILVLAPFFGHALPRRESGLNPCFLHNLCMTIEGCRRLGSSFVGDFWIADLFGLVLCWKARFPYTRQWNIGSVRWQATDVKFDACLLRDDLRARTSGRCATFRRTSNHKAVVEWLRGRKDEDLWLRVNHLDRQRYEASWSVPRIGSVTSGH